MKRAGRCRRSRSGVNWNYGPIGKDVEMEFVDPPNSLIDVFQWHLVNDLPIEDLIPGVSQPFRVTDMQIHSSPPDYVDMTYFGDPQKTYLVQQRRVLTIRGKG